MSIEKIKQLLENSEKKQLIVSWIETNWDETAI